MSRSYWNICEPAPAIDQYLQTVKPELLSNWGIYSIGDKIAVDCVGRYERLN